MANIQKDREPSDFADVFALVTFHLLICSVDGRSVIQSQNRACVSHGKLYYMLAGEKSQFLYEVPLTGTDIPRLIKEYTSEYEIRETLTLYAIEDSVYITLVSGITSDTNNYII